MLTAIGLPAVAANVTNTVALCPGYLGRAGAAADLGGQGQQLWFALPAGVLGDIGGGLLLLGTGERAFRPGSPADSAGIGLIGGSRSAAGLVAAAPQDEPGAAPGRNLECVSGGPGGRLRRLLRGGD